MSSSTFKRRIASHYLLYRGGLLRGGVVEVDFEGRIASVTCPESIDSLHSTEFYGGVLISEPVNALRGVPAALIEAIERGEQTEEAMKITPHGGGEKRLLPITPRLSCEQVEEQCERFGDRLFLVVVAPWQDAAQRLLSAMGSERRARLNICIGGGEQSPAELIEGLRTMSAIPLSERLGWCSKGAEIADGTDAGEIEVGRSASLWALSGIDFERGEIGETFKIEKIV